MKPLLYRSEEPVTLVGGGPVNVRHLESALAYAPDAIAVDGGLNRVLPDGLRFRAVIGDLDSASPQRIDALEKSGGDIWHIREQDTTDFEKCLLSIRAPLILGLGFLGGRVDHQLVAMNILVRYPHQRIVLLGEDDICFHCPQTLELDLEKGTRVSLFPMRMVQGTMSEGLKWSVSGLQLHPDGLTSTSNEASGGKVRIGFDGPGTVVILPHCALRQVMDLIGA